jgi:hypothetical protein
LNAARAVNPELVGLYWDIGSAILEKQRVTVGDAVVENLARDRWRRTRATAALCVESSAVIGT